MSTYRAGTNGEESVVICRRGPTGMEVVVLGGHMSVGLSKQWIAPPALATRGHVSRWWWVAMSMYVCDRLLSMSKHIVE